MTQLRHLAPFRRLQLLAPRRNFGAFFLGILLLTTVASARPPLDDEYPFDRAVYKGQTQTGYVSGSVPKQYLQWDYAEPDWKKWFLDYVNWENEHLRYLSRTYGVDSLKFQPSMIVMHYTVVPTAEETYAVLQRRRVSVHFLIDRDGSVYQLLPLDRRCNGAYGVNHKALSIEMVATTEPDLLSRPFQVFQSFCLVRQLMEAYNIKLEKVVGHNEVGQGVSRVPDYLDLHDRYSPTKYPPSSKRTDPGERYMTYLRSFLSLELR